VFLCTHCVFPPRPAARFVKLAEQFEAEIWVEREGQSVSGRSIMGLMMLAAGPGSPILLSASGRDAADAIAALARLVESKFDED
jgi:phosphocarrier protein HPr